MVKINLNFIKSKIGISKTKLKKPLAIRIIPKPVIKINTSIASSSDEATHFCTLCNKLIHSSNIAKHMKIHTIVRPFKCMKCPSTFKFKLYLEKHISLRHSESPKNDTLTNSRNGNNPSTSSASSNVATHFCTLCNKLIHTSNMNKHMKIHNTVRPFKCMKCTSTFKFKIHLNKHMRLRHNEMPENETVAVASSGENAEVQKEKRKVATSSEYAKKNKRKSKVPTKAVELDIENFADSIDTTSIVEESVVDTNVQKEVTEAIEVEINKSKRKPRVKAVSIPEGSVGAGQRNKRKPRTAVVVSNENKRKSKKVTAVVEKSAERNKSKRKPKVVTASPEESVDTGRRNKRKSRAAVVYNENSSSSSDTDEETVEDTNTNKRKSKTVNSPDVSVVDTSSAQKNKRKRRSKARIASSSDDEGGKDTTSDNDSVDTSSAKKKKNAKTNTEHFCNICNNTITSNFKRHMQSHNTERPFKCDKCDAAFKFKHYLNDHLVREHNEIVEGREDTKKQQKEKESTTRVCTICGKNVLAQSFQRHIRSHSDARPHKCNQCGMAYKEPFQLRDHLRKHNPPGETPSMKRKRPPSAATLCPLCGKSFTSSLARHMRTHTDERPYKCDQCGKAFRQSNNLLGHMLTHRKNDITSQLDDPTTSETITNISNLTFTRNPYKRKDKTCNICGKQFKSSLSRHMQIHKDERPFKCDQCGMAFKQKPHLRDHMLIHTGQRPYSCDKCSASFQRLYFFKEHMAKEHGVDKDKVEYTRLASMITLDQNKENHDASTLNQQEKENNNASSSIPAVEITAVAFVPPPQLPLPAPPTAPEPQSESIVHLNDEDIAFLFDHFAPEDNNTMNAIHYTPVTFVSSMISESPLTPAPFVADPMSHSQIIITKFALAPIELAATTAPSVAPITETPAPPHYTDLSLQPFTTTRIAAQEVNRELAASVEEESQEPAVTIEEESQDSGGDDGDYESLDETEKTQPTTETTTVNGKKKFKRRTHLCPLCGKTFISSIGRHMRTHTEYRPFKCDQCDMAFREKTKLAEHVLIHTGERPHKCEHCDESFQRLYLYKQHLLKQHQVDKFAFKRPKAPLDPEHEKLVKAKKKAALANKIVPKKKCDICNKEIDIRWLKQHIKQHGNERPFKCDQCGLTFKRRNHLTKHAVRHTDQRPYPCNQCDKSFYTKNDHNRHLFTHSEVKHFGCKLCDKSYSTRDNLVRHVRIFHEKVATRPRSKKKQQQQQESMEQC